MIFRKREKAPQPAWRIEQDPHSGTFTVEKLDGRYIGGPFGGGVIRYWTPVFNADALDKAEEWLSREVKRPIVCGVFTASGDPMPNI